MNFLIFTLVIPFPVLLEGGVSSCLCGAQLPTKVNPQQNHDTEGQERSLSVVSKHIQMAG